ncbi:hypothetical protein C9374_009621 [Naegleria lovaniensis]|uniref:Uncharacterized protein n=1 Tax=Naegleria lovaniensis TaxID=51637 RepID=A0AA88GYR7_NAELO|nr:uncharacterized protein C9374_009621 [Naegleria lovaniensis]KAG2393044.1 hypothetical protein C9374_009621 [Naegleria lovaniensis]
MHSSYFLNLRSSRPRKNDEEQDENILVEVSKDGTRNVIITGKAQDSEEVALGEDVQAIDIPLPDEDQTEERCQNPRSLQEISKQRELQQQRLETIERDYLRLRERNSLTVVADASRNVNLKSSLSSYRTVKFNDTIEDHLEIKDAPKVAFQDTNQVEKRVQDMIKEVKLDDDNESIISEEESKPDYEHFYNNPETNNEQLDEAEEGKEYNWNDVSDTLTVVSEVSEFYQDFKNINQEKAEKKKITVPLPFSFEERESMKPKGIHRRKMEEYIGKIKLEEEHHLNKRFKANPVPKTTKQALYNSIKMRTEYQLTLQKKALKEMTKSIVKPFYFAERDRKRLKEIEKERIQKKESEIQEHTRHFKANPVPSHTFKLMFASKLEAEARRRNNRVKERSEHLLRSSSLPPRMEMWKKVSANQEKSIPHNPLDDELTHKPKINHNVPDFEVKQREFQETLYLAKRTKKPTVPRPFKFHNSMSERDLKRIAGEVGIDDDFISTYSKLDNTRNDCPKRPSSAVCKSSKKPLDTNANKLRNDLIKKQISEREERKKQLDNIRRQQEKQQNRISKQVIPNIEQPSRRTYQTTSSATNEKRTSSPTAPYHTQPYLFETSLKKKVREKVLEDLKQVLEENGTSYLLSRFLD